MLTLNTKLIPALKRNGITFRYIDGVYNTMTIIITHKNIDICRVDVLHNSNELYNYCVYWFSVVDFLNCRRDKYESSENLIGDIKIVIGYLENRIKNNNDMYYVGGRHLGKSYTTYIDEIEDQSTVRMLAKTLLRGGVGIKDVIFNDPATIVLWADGTKTVVKAENEPFDPEKGLAMAIAKKALGNNYDYYDVFKKYVGRYEKKQKKGGK